MHGITRQDPGKLRISKTETVGSYTPASSLASPHGRRLPEAGDFVWRICMKLIMYLIGALLLLGTVGCETDEGHHYDRGGYYDHGYYGYGRGYDHPYDRDHYWYRDRD